MKIGNFLLGWVGISAITLTHVGCASKQSSGLPPTTAASALAPALAGPGTPSTPAKPQATIDPDDQLVDYRVAKGDSLWLIARKFHTSVGKIQAANNLSDSKIIEGKKLKIPTKNPPSAEELAAGAPAAAAPAVKEAPAPAPAPAPASDPAAAPAPAAPAAPSVEPPAPPASGPSFSFPSGGLKIQD